LKKKSAGDVIFLVKRNPNAPTMVFGEQTPSQLEEKKVFAKIVSKSNQIKIVFFKKETSKGIMPMTAKALMEINVLRIRQTLEFDM
jgi:hypothetical protein